MLFDSYSLWLIKNIVHTYVHFSVYHHVYIFLFLIEVYMCTTRAYHLCYCCVLASHFFPFEHKHKNQPHSQNYRNNNSNSIKFIPIRPYQFELYHICSYLTAFVRLRSYKFQINPFYYHCIFWNKPHIAITTATGYIPFKFDRIRTRFNWIEFIRIRPHPLQFEYHSFKFDRNR